MNKKKIIYLIVVLVALVSWWGVETVKQRQAGSLKKVTLQLKWLHQSQFAGFYAAAQKGFYRDEGLDVTIIPVGDDLSAQNVLERAARGEIQFGVVGGDQVVSARSENKPIKALAVIYQQSPVGLISLKKLGVVSLKDLIGKTTGVWGGQDTQIVYHAMLSNAGIDSKKIKEIDITSGIYALVSKKIDTQMVYLINEGLEAKEMGYSFNTIYPEDYGVQFYGDTLVAGDALIDQNPELVQSFVRASLKGWNWAIENPNEAGMLPLLYNSKLSEAHEVNMMQASLPFIYTSKTRVGNMDPATWEGMESILLKGGIIKKHVPVDDIFTTKFLQI